MPISFSMVVLTSQLVVAVAEYVISITNSTTTPGRYVRGGAQKYEEYHSLHCTTLKIVSPLRPTWLRISGRKTTHPVEASFRRLFP